MAFIDDFTGIDGEYLYNRPGWNLNSGGTGATILSNGLKVNVGTPQYWKALNQNSADNYVITKFVAFDIDHQETFVCTRFVDVNNYLGIRIYGTGSAGLRLTKTVAGVHTDLVTAQGAINQWVKAEAEGATARFYKGDTGATPVWVQEGTDQTYSENITSTHQGIRADDDIDDNVVWIDYFKAEALEGAVGPVNFWSGETVGGTSVTVTVSNVTSGNILLATVTKDDDIATAGPSGWVLVGGIESANNMYLEIWKREADGTEASVIWTGDSEDYVADIVELDGTVYDYTTITLATLSAGVDAVPISPTITPPTDGSMVLVGFGADDDDTPYSLDAQLTTLTAANGHISTTGNGTCGQAFGYFIQGTAGATGTFTHSQAASEEWVAWTLYIEPLAATGDNLLADDVESAGEVTSPVIGQLQILLADSVQATCENSLPDFTQKNILLANNAETNSEVSLPLAAESNVLLADAVQSTSEVTNPVVSQEHTFISVSAEGTSEVSVPLFTQLQTLLADDSESTSELSAPALIQAHILLVTSVQNLSEVTTPVLEETLDDVLLADDVEATSEVTLPAFTQEQVLLATAIEAESNTTLPLFAQAHTFLANAVQSNSEVTNPVISSSGAHILLAEDAESLSEITSPTFVQGHIFDAIDIEVASEVDTPDLTQEHGLLVDDVQSLTEINDPVLSEAGHALLANDIESTSETNSPVLSEIYVLVGNSAENSSEVAIPAFWQEHTLSADDVQSVSAVSNPVLAQAQGVILSQARSINRMMQSRIFGRIN